MIKIDIKSPQLYTQYKGLCKIYLIIMQNSDNKLEIKITCYFLQLVRTIITYCFTQEIPKKI